MSKYREENNEGTRNHHRQQTRIEIGNRVAQHRPTVQSPASTHVRAGWRKHSLPFAGVCGRRILQLLDDIVQPGSSVGWTGGLKLAQVFDDPCGMIISRRPKSRASIENAPGPRQLTAITMTTASAAVIGMPSGPTLDSGC